LTPPLIRPVPFNRTRPRIVRGSTNRKELAMSNETKTGNMPTHDIFAVKDSADGKGFWTKIGAAWAHNDNKGLSLKFDFYPADGQAIQLRVIKAKAEKGGAQ
jgi:hypothetical protein